MVSDEFTYAGTVLNPVMECTFSDFEVGMFCDFHTGRGGDPLNLAMEVLDTIISVMCS